MDTPSFSQAVAVQRHYRRAGSIAWLGALIGLSLLAVPGFAAQVPVRDGQTVKLKLRNILTTDNVQKGDTIDFDVAEDILVSGHVVIAKGATAHGRIIDIKGAFNPRSRDADVVFQFTTVTAADKQELPLRPQPGKSKRSKDDEVHERSLIPGQISRIVGADKGKEYQAYVNGSFTIAASDAIAAPPGVAPVAPAAAPPGAPAAPATPAASLPLAAADVASMPSSVEFGSTPDGAEIVIDGNVVGNTPSTLRLTPGHHAIEIRMAGYRTWSRIMVVDPESHPSVRATLVKQ